MFFVTLALLAHPIALAQTCDPALRAANGGVCPAPSGASSASGGSARLPMEIQDPVFDRPCDPVDMTGPGGSMEHVPVRDQDGMGICYSEAATELVDAWRFSHGDTNYAHRTSAVEAAIGSGIAEWIPQDDIEGGQACHVVDYVRDHGSCDNRAVMETFGSHTLHDALEGLQTWFEDYRAFHSAEATILEAMGSSLGGTVTRARHHASLDSTVAGVLGCLQQLGVRETLRPTAEALRAALEQDDPLEFQRVALARQCESASHLVRPADLPGCSPDYYDSARLLHRELQRRITRVHAQPVSISFCAAVLARGSRTREITRRGMFGTPLGLSQDDSCGHHEALVVGQRRSPVTGRCQYLVRNSWGADCGYYASSGWECHDGSLWVDAEALANNTWSISSLGD